MFAALPSRLQPAVPRPPGSGAAAGASFATTPFALIDLPAFLNGFGTQAAALTPAPILRGQLRFTRS
jgi:hypothetical protein